MKCLNDASFDYAQFIAKTFRRVECNREDGKLDHLCAEPERVDKGV